MLFNSHLFLFTFLPITWIGFIFLKRRHPTNIVIGWLTTASILFYSWNNFWYACIFVISIICNYYFSLLLRSVGGVTHLDLRRMLLGLGIAVNLLVLGYFKYTHFLLDGLNHVSGFHLQVYEIVLPIGISFHTFQQIGYLVDVFRSKIRVGSLLQHYFFVSFFPQLIAGPIVHYDQIMSQVQTTRWPRVSFDHLSTGTALLSIGLFKKTLISTRISVYSSCFFAAAAKGTPLSFFEAWSALLCFAMEIYFDFSGYSDMARGLGYLFGIKFPVNFDSPYQAIDIIDFWRRWHITLSNFLRDYLYIPLGGSKRGRFDQFRNLMITMILAGLWHGANWTFLVWGALHGFCLGVCHAWRSFREKRSALFSKIPSKPTMFISRTLTFLLVTLLWAFFRASDLGTAWRIVKSAVGCYGFALSRSWLQPLNMLGHFGDRLIGWGWTFSKMSYPMGWIQILICLWVVQCLPNSQRWVEGGEAGPNVFGASSRNVISGRTTSVLSAAIVAAIAVMGIMNISLAGQFIYYRF